MSDETNNMSIEAQLEAAELDPPKPERRGFDSLRGVRRAVYMRRSLLRMLSKSPEELEAYSPRNGFEMIARNLILASNAKDRNADVAVAVFKECKESLGEKVGVAGRPSQEERARQNTQPIVNDLPGFGSQYKMPKSDDRTSNPRIGRCRGGLNHARASRYSRTTLALNGPDPRCARAGHKSRTRGDRRCAATAAGSTRSESGMKVR